jgi:hypothetical protein
MYQFLLSSMPAQTQEVAQFVFDSFEKNVVVATLAFLVIALVAIFIYWRKDTKKFLEENEAHRNALASVVKDFNERLDDKDKQVMTFALEMKDAMNALTEKSKDV